MTCWQTFHHRSITCTSLYNIFWHCRYARMTILFF